MDADEIERLRRDNARLRRLLDAKDAPGELRHQTRNMLTLMRSLLRRSTAFCGAAEDFAAKIEGRFDAVLRVQTLAIAASHAGVPLHRLIGDEWTAQLIRLGDAASLDGPDVAIEANAAGLLALAIHELTGNALQHGGVGGPGGALGVSWSRAAGCLHIVWREAATWPVEPPTSRGFGLETVENLLRAQLGAVTTLRFTPQGLHCEIALPEQHGGRRLVTGA